MAEKINPVGMNKASLREAMYDLLAAKFPELSDQAAYAAEFGIELAARDKPGNYEYRAMIELVQAIQQDEAPEPLMAVDPAPPAPPAAKAAKVKYYRSRQPRKVGIRPTIQGARPNGAGLVEMVPIAGPIHLVFGNSPYGVCEVTEELAQSYRKPDGGLYTFEEFVALIESSDEYVAGGFWEIPPSHVHTLPDRSESLKTTRGPVATGGLGRK